MSASSPSDSELVAKFWDAVCANDMALVTTLLDEDASLAGTDCRPAEQQDPHTNGFPLVQAAKKGNREMVELLLQMGADPDARSPSEDQRELGIPILTAIENEDYDLANLLLDQGASVHGYPYCARPTIETLYYQALDAGASPDIVCPGFEHLLGADATAGLQLPEVTDDAPEPIKLYERFLELGGQPNLVSLLRTQRLTMLEKLLRTCPNEPAPPLDYPSESVFNSVVHSASWFGYPQVIRLAMEICPDLYNAEVARRAVGSAIISHNRDGSWEEYRELIKSQLDYLDQIGELDALRASEDFQPIFMLAENYCWPRNYGYKAGLSSPEGMIAIAQLLLDYGFDGVNHRDAKSNHTPLSMVRSREGHPGMEEFAQFLLDQGADAES